MSVRDYKRARRAALDLDGSQFRAFALGLGLGLAVAAVVYVSDHRVRAATAAAAAPAAMARPVPQQIAPDDVGLPPVRAADPSGGTAGHAPQSSPTINRFDFYQMLPRARVLVATHEHVSHTAPAPATPLEQPSDYALQIGSYRDAAVAERVRAQAARLGVSATIQRVTVDSEVWHRVRVGPVHGLSALKRIRQQLQGAGLSSLVVHAGN